MNERCVGIKIQEVRFITDEPHSMLYFKLTPRIQRNEDRLREDTEREIRTLRDGLRLLNNQLDKVCAKIVFDIICLEF